MNRHSESGLFLAGVDFLALAIFLFYGHRLRLDYAIPMKVGGESLAVVLVTVLILYLLGGYNVRTANSRSALLARSACAVLVSVAVITSAVFFVKPDISTTILWRGNLAVALLLFLFWVIASRFFLATVLKDEVKNKTWLFIGSQNWADRLTAINTEEGGAINLETRIVEFPDCILSIDYRDSEIRLQTKKGLLSCSEIGGLVIENLVDLEWELRDSILALRSQRIVVSDFSEFCEKHYGRLPVTEGMKAILLSAGIRPSVATELNWRTKRIADVLLGGILLICALPLILVLATIIVFDSNGSPVFSQVRTGLGASKFTLYKLRTMYHQPAGNSANWTEENDARITRVGRVLRRFHLDELPQLWNVVNGTMSLVGPRPEQPEIVKILERELPSYDLRHLTRPGVTGWAQIRFSYGSSVEDAHSKLEFDLYYLKHFSLLLDAYIMLKTLRVILSSHGR